MFLWVVVLIVMSDDSSDADGSTEFEFDPMGQTLASQVRDHVENGNQVPEDTFGDLTKYDKMAVIYDITADGIPDDSGANAGFSDDELVNIIGGLTDLHADGE